jgi:hypothetical protein
MTVRYQDTYLTLDDDGLTIRAYYFPYGAKRILYADIQRVERYTLSFWTGKGRIWGGSHRYWLHLDPKRPAKTDAWILHLHSQYVCPVVTPDDPAAFEAALTPPAP